jgi:hypothetical protein
MNFNYLYQAINVKVYLQDFFRLILIFHKFVYILNKNIYERKIL